MLYLTRYSVYDQFETYNCFAMFISNLTHPRCSDSFTEKADSVHKTDACLQVVLVVFSYPQTSAVKELSISRSTKLKLKIDTIFVFSIKS